MTYRAYIIAFVLSATALHSELASSDTGLFRTLSAGTPERGTIWVSNSAFYAPIEANSVLKDRYGVTKSDVMSSLTHASLGLTNRIALTGTFPFYADMFSQGSRSGEKTGPGDVAVGLRMSLKPRGPMRSITVGGGVCIPEEMGYGAEPLGFRTFSTGELAYNAEMSFGFAVKSAEAYVSGIYHASPNVKPPSVIRSGDVFYESAYGYLGIGRADADGRAEVIFQDHVILTTGFAVPVRPWVSGLFEVSAAKFIEKPRRDTIMRAASGVRVGKTGGFNVSTGIDFRLSGDIPSHTYLLQVTIPFLKPRDLLRKPLPAEPVRKDLVRSRNSLVAVNDFGKSDLTFPYEKEVKNAFLRELESMRIMDIVSEERVNTANARMRFVARKEGSERLGIRLGANYLINADVSEYSVERSTQRAIPLVLDFPQTTLSISANATVTDLVTGKTHNLGNITASMKKSRGMRFFPQGPSSDLVYHSEPERRIYEKELIDLWVKQFNQVIIDNLDVFGWEPKRTELRGDEETKG